ncbi:MAG: COX15/CtaA family protein [Planctomycetes bacterium]|nr:COX15/CtaA family protein [Planctomycetota bacterium]
MLTSGFSITVLMWLVGYAAHQPGLSMPPVLTFGLLIACMLAGGFVAVRIGGLSRAAAVGAGAVSGLVNLLILGSLLGGRQRDAMLPAELARVALVWAAATVLLGAIVVGIGGLLAPRDHDRAGTRCAGGNWPMRFACVAVLATLLLLSVGGVVTGFQAGLAVPDWPNTYGYNMFLFPLSKMTGGIYYEHSHRLFGVLVGLTTLTLAVYLTRVERRGWVRAMIWLILLVVCVQGLLGALRVTGKFTLSTAREELAPNLTLAVVHGVLAQAILSGLACLAVVLSRRWATAPSRVEHERAGTDAQLGGVCVLLALMQILAGAMLRHFSWGLYLHLSLAGLVVGLVGLYAIRIWSLYDDHAPLQRMGAVLVSVLGLQLLLGFTALGGLMLQNPGGAIPAARVLITTAHQTTGAILLALTSTTLLWHLRLVRPRRAFVSNHDASAAAEVSQKESAPAADAG